MEKRTLQSYAVWAKTNLENQIEVQLKTLGINSERDIKTARKVGDRTIIDGDMNSYPADLKNKRDDIVRLIQKDGYKQVIEEFAYTWFNRIIALRFMEVHDFLPHGFRVLSSKTGGFEPEIMKNLNFVKDELKLDLSVISPLMEQGKIDEAYRYVLFRQCNALSRILPMLFSAEQSYLELLLPKALLRGETFITKLLEIGENDFLNDVEVIGWLYQFYISQKKEEVFSAKEIINKDNLAAVTQLFTPDWIVRYMTENSLGKIWMESYPHSPLRNIMDFYIDDKKHNDMSNMTPYKNVNPEEIKIIEPCCGSGHILVYIFDLLYRMYEEKGYSKRDIPTLILSKNITGLDIDKRAAQLASFSLIMKARSINSKFFNEEFFVEPNVIEIWDSRSLHLCDYKNQLNELKLLTQYQIDNICSLVNLFQYGKVTGSLIQVNSIDLIAIEESIKTIEKNAVITIFNSMFLNEGILCIKHLLKQAFILSDKYDVFITNPPYVNLNNLEKKMKDYANIYYPDSKADMFSMFMEREDDLLKENGFSAFLTPYVWMFIQSYEKVRKYIYSNYVINSLVQLEYNAFEAACVPVCSFTLRKSRNQFTGTYIRLSDFKGVDQQAPKTLEAIRNSNCSYRFLCNQNNFKKIPGNPVAYWVSDAFIKAFEHSKLSRYADAKKGASTSDNDKYLRFWFECSLNNLFFGCKSHSDSLNSNKKWYPYNKGGEFRKWYGNNIFVVDWQHDGKNLSSFDKAIIRNPEYYFEESLTWTDLSNYKPSFRYNKGGFIHDCAGPCVFRLKDNIFYLQGLLNSKVTEKIFEVTSPTMHFNIGTTADVPVIIQDDKKSFINDLVKCNVSLSKDDWDSFETSWDFKKHPLVSKGTIDFNFKVWKELCEKRFNTLKNNEEIINETFIKIYGLEKEIDPTVLERDVTVNHSNVERDIKSLVSYLIGIEMGRYSLDVDGLAYAGGEWNPMNYVTYQPDNDGIIPIYPQLGMSDGLTSRIIKLIKHIYGEDTYKENIDFIAGTLGKKNNESSEETLNRYLNESFYADHLKTYQKRPIYWMFSSGKTGAFKCLIYLHRYNEDTLARINSKYFLNESARLNAEVNDIAAQLEAADGREKLRLDKLYKTLTAKQKEMLEYGWVLDHMANKYIPLDLDDGVKANYAIFQGIEIVNDNGAKVKKDLLVPIK